MDKKSLREYCKLQRSELNEQEREERSLAIANKSLEMDIWDRKIYHIFLPILRLGEINTEYFLNILNGKDKDIVIPKTDFSTNTMSHYLLTDSTSIQINTWGIPEPQDGIIIEKNLLDVIFVPLLGFDLKGNRLGYGKGFYDRFLAQCKEDCLKIGLSYFAPLETIPAEKNDILLDACITADKIYNF